MWYATATSSTSGTPRSPAGWLGRLVAGVLLAGLAACGQNDCDVAYATVRDCWNTVADCGQLSQAAYQSQCLAYKASTAPSGGWQVVSTTSSRDSCQGAVQAAAQSVLTCTQALLPSKGCVCPGK